MGWNSGLRSRGEHQLETGSKSIPIKECAGREDALLRNLGSNAWMAYYYYAPFASPGPGSGISTKQPFLLRTKRNALATLNVRKIIEANTIYNNWRINDRSLD